MSRIKTFRRPSIGGGSDRRFMDRLYDRTKRDQDAKRFYDSSSWRKLRASKLIRNPECQDCLELHDVLVPARFVHHVLSRKERPDLVFSIENLRSLCPACHNRTEKGEKSKGKGQRTPKHEEPHEPSYQ
ncbi:MAG: HNH endonuclease [Isosphaeraceae bacterium]